MDKNTKALIFGVNGQDGYYLQQLLRNLGVNVTGVSRSAGNIVGNVANYTFVKSLIDTEQPDYIFHLAANSSTRHEVLFENHESIATGTLNILEAVKLTCPSCRVFLSGSAMQFKNVGDPINELTEFEASSPYSVSRIQSVYAGRYYREKFGIKVFIGYFFNHDSPSRTEHHVNQKIVEAVKRIKNGSNEKLSLGDINVKKEFNFAGDIVNAVWILVNQNHISEAVIGNGLPYSIKDWVKYCFDKIGKNWSDYVTEKPGFRSEYDLLVSDPTLIKSLGWQFKIDFYALADLMLN